MNPIIEKYRKSHPHIAIVVKWDYDPGFTWDGDGPDPELENLYPHDVTVIALRIDQGVLHKGFNHLGGCYAPLSGPYPEDINGYLKQMIEEAIQDLKFDP